MFAKVRGELLKGVSFRRPDDEVCSAAVSDKQLSHRQELRAGLGTKRPFSGSRFGQGSSTLSVFADLVS